MEKQSIKTTISAKLYGKDTHILSLLKNSVQLKTQERVINIIKQISQTYMVISSLQGS